MFLLDTNVCPSSAGRSVPTLPCRPGQAARRPPSRRMVVTVLELEWGILLVERRDPRQGAILRRWLEDQVLAPFASRILPIDLAVVRRCAALHVPDLRPERDALIAATALVNGLTVVTRNTSDFAPMSVPVLDPWHAAGA